MITQLPPAPARPRDAHKGTFGHTLIVAGSRMMSGAARLAGEAALRSGAGLVTLAVPQSILPIVAGHDPSYMVWPLDEDDSGKLTSEAAGKILARIQEFDALGIGPGWGQSPSLCRLAERLFLEVERPMVLDADALNALAVAIMPRPEQPAPSLQSGATGSASAALASGGCEPPVSLNEDSQRPMVPVADARGSFLIHEQETGGSLGLRPPLATAPRILTPHPGEFARLTGRSIAEISSSRSEIAAEFAAKHRVILVLKGAGTIVTDGTRLAINTTGNSGLSKGGTGDVLTGLLTGLLGQGMPPFEAAQFAVHLHGLAGDLAAAALSEQGMTANDLVRYLCEAWKQV